MIWDLWVMPVRFKNIHREFARRSFSLLDVGCGSAGQSQTRKYFPYCQYHGVDLELYKTPIEHAETCHFYQLNLEKDDLSALQDNSFDVLIAAHLLEHLYDPYSVLRSLCQKVKRGGKIYLEFPSLKSMGLPSMDGTMQFCDDPTHIHLPDPNRVINILLSEGIAIRKAAIRRDLFRLFATPLFLVKNLARKMVGKKSHSRGLWDLKGFAYSIYAEKR